MSKLTENAIRLRLDPGNWPAELDRKELSAPFGLNTAIEAATDVFNRFQQAHREHATSGKLTPAGVRAVDAEFAAAHLPALRERLAKVRQTAAETEAGLMGKLTADLAVPATEASDVALMQEIRTWLRSLPEQERLTRARQLASNGDKTALRAMLTAPTYLTGVNDELLALVRDEAAKRAHPERHAKLEEFRKAASVAERAVEGVIRYVEQETAGSFVAPISASSAA